jgi:hypothetical protein
MTTITLNRQMRKKWVKEQLKRIERGEREPMDPT